MNKNTAHHVEDGLVSLTGSLGFIGLVVIAALLSGCSYRSYQEGQTKYTSFAFGTAQTVAPFSLKAGKEGEASYRELTSKGVTNDSSAAIEAAVGAAVKAATGR